MIAALLAAGLALCASARKPAPVYLIGIDGASWNVMRPLLAAGKLPNLERLAKAGAAAPLGSLDPMISPALWTSIATGRRAPEHGVSDFFVGRRRLTSDDRRAPALWNVFSEARRPVCVVGYMTTWPAETVDGVLVSDQLLNRSLKGRLAYPEDALNGLGPAQAWDDEAASSAPRLRRFLPFDYDPAYKKLPAGSDERLENELVERRLSWVYMRDESFARVAEKLLARSKPDFFAIHLWGVDYVSHGFWKFMPPPAEGVSPRLTRDLGGVIAAYYEYADELVGRLLRQAGPDADVLVVSDHGFQAWTAKPGEAHAILSGNHAKEGVLIAAGPDIRQGGAAPGATLLDLFPTILYLADLPVPQGLPGRRLDGLLDPALLARRPLTFTRPYASRPAPHDGPGVPLAPDELDRLRASGYLK